jgi:hypothetical protein
VQVPLYQSLGVARGELSTPLFTPGSFLGKTKYRWQFLIFLINQRKQSQDGNLLRSVHRDRLSLWTAVGEPRCYSPSLRPAMFIYIAQVRTVGTHSRIVFFFLSSILSRSSSRPAKDIMHSVSYQCSSALRCLWDSPERHRMKYTGIPCWLARKFIGVQVGGRGPNLATCLCEHNPLKLSGTYYVPPASTLINCAFCTYVWLLHDSHCKQRLFP